MKDRILQALIIILLTMTAFSCKKDMNSLVASGLVGIWTNPVYADSLITFDRNVTLPDNDYAIVFLNDNAVLERKNSGECGTPPIIYGDYKGNWFEKSGNVYMTVPYWGGTLETTWKIVSIDENYLKVVVLEQKMNPQLD